MKNITRRTALGLGLSVTFVVGATKNAFAADPIKIGFPANLTGNAASLDTPMLNGGKLAAAEINAAGGMMGTIAIE